MEILKWLETWIPLIIGILTIVTMVSGIFYTIYTTFTKFVKHEIQEVTKEFKPNGGSSLKDQVFEKVPQSLQADIIRKIRDRKGLAENQ